MHQHLVGFDREEGVLFIGRAQEKTALFRTERRRDANGDSYPWIVKTTGVVKHFYVYAVDAEFGPFFPKFRSYFPTTFTAVHHPISPATDTASPGYAWATAAPTRCSKRYWCSG